MEITESDYIRDINEPQIIEVITNSIALSPMDLIEDTKSVILSNEKNLCSTHYKISIVKEIMKNTLVLPKPFENCNSF